MPNPMNVYFKRGTQSALDTLITSNASSAQGVFKAGAFYLTEDTNRLYFAQANNKLVELNQFIHIVPTGETLPDSTTNPNLKAGDFYYWTDNNILAVYTGLGDTNGWIQINPDTRLKASANAVTTADGSDAETYGVLLLLIAAQSDAAFLCKMVCVVQQLAQNLHQDHFIGENVKVIRDRCLYIEYNHFWM